MNPVGIIGVIILAVILDVPWALYYLAAQFVFLFVRDEYLLVSIIGMIPPIYFGLPWWYDLLLFQHFLFVCASRSSAESFLEGKMDEIEADGVRRVAYHVSSALMLISVIGSFYWFFSK